MNCRLRNEWSTPSKVGKRHVTGVREGHWSELAVHCGLFAGPACSSYVAAYGINGSQGELSGLLVRSVSDFCKARDALKMFRIVCD